MPVPPSLVGEMFAPVRDLANGHPQKSIACAYVFIVALEQARLAPASFQSLQASLFLALTVSQVYNR